MKKKSIFSPKSGSLLNKSLEKFRMPGFQNFWSYGMSIRAQTLVEFRPRGARNSSPPGLRGFKIRSPGAPGVKIKPPGAPWSPGRPLTDLYLFCV